MKFLILLMLLSFIACSHHKDVVKKPDGNHTISVARQDPGSSEKLANDEAKDFCDQERKSVKVVEQKTIQEKREGRGIASDSVGIGIGAGSYGGGGSMFMGMGIPYTTKATYHITNMTFRCE